VRRFRVEVLNRLNQRDMFGAKLLPQARKVQPLLTLDFPISPVHWPIDRLLMGFALSLIRSHAVEKLLCVCLQLGDVGLLSLDW